MQLLFNIIVFYIFVCFSMLCQVRRVVLVEMTALFVTAGIELKAHKAVKVKTKGTHTHTHTHTHIHYINTDIYS